MIHGEGERGGGFEPPAESEPTQEQIERENKKQERLENARQLFDDFLGLREGEKVLFITDNNNFNTNRELIDILKSALEQKGVECSEIVGDSDLKSADFFKIVENSDIIWNSWDMNDTDIDWDGLIELIEKRKNRMAFCPGLKADSIDSDGALSENKEELENRLGRMGERLRDVRGFRITSRYGTDLKISIKTDERRWVKDSGVISPGKWDNLPGGEIFTTPDEGQVEGVLVLPVLQDEVSLEQGVDEFVRLTIQRGKITKIDGGQSAEKLRQYLEENSKNEDDPYSVLRCAEVAFGANSKARSVVSNPEGKYTDLTHPTVETEKRLGTMHIAFGSAKHGEEGAEGLTESDVHLDFVLPRHGLTVTAFNRYDDFKKEENGYRLIDEGRWNFLE